MSKTKKILKRTGIVILSPIVLFLILAILIYIPPVQNFAVKKVAEYLSESMNMDIRVEKVRLAFPLDLAVHRVTAIEQQDTLFALKSLRLNVQLLPLAKGQAVIDGFGAYGLKLDTKSYVADTHIKGTAEELTATANPVDWKNEHIKIEDVRLRNARFDIALSDTAQKDTTQSEAKWNIEVRKACIENTRISLSMPGDSMRVGGLLGRAMLTSGVFDIGNNYYAVKQLTLRDSEADYDLPLVKPMEGIDPNHIHATDIALILDTLSYNNKGELRAGLRSATLKERCGLAVNKLRGQVYMDTTQLRVPALNLHTAHSQINAGVAFDFRSFDAGKGGHCSALIDASIGKEDIRALAKGYVDEAMLKALPAAPLTVNAKVSGNIDHLLIDHLTARIPGTATFEASGTVQHAMQAWRSGDIKLSLQTYDLSAMRRMLPKSVTESVNLPNGISAKGTVGFKGDNYRANLRIAQGGGSITAKGEANLQRETYRLTAQAQRFPIAHFVKGVPVGPFSGTLRASGCSFDPLAARASLTADAHVQGLSYDKYDLSGLKLDATLRHGLAKATFSTGTNPLVQGRGELTALLGKTGYEADLKASIEQLDMMKLGVTKDTLWVGTDIDIKAKANKAFTAYSAAGGIRHNRFMTNRISTMAKDILFDFATSKDTTTASVSAGDLVLDMGSKGDVPLLTKQLTRFMDEAAKQADDKAIDQEKLKTMLPVLSFRVDAGRDNPVYNIARMKGYSFNSASIHLNTNPQEGMAGDIRMGMLKMGGLQLDTIDADILQDSTGVQMKGIVKNGKKNPTPLEVQMHAHLLKAGAGVDLVYLDAKGQKGVDLGVRAELTENGAYMHFYPEHPVLAYRNFTVNKGNYIYFGKDKTIRADVDLLADDGTGLKIYGEPRDSMNDVTVSVNQVNLSELSSVLPYMPKLDGMLSGDFHLTASHDYKDLSAVASIDAEGFKYEGTPLGNIGMEAIYLPKTGGEHHASAFISSNGEEVLACNGTYYDRDGGSFTGDAELHDFPLQMLNGFMVGTDVALKGIAGGELNIAGTLDKPVVNGALDLDSAHIYSDVYGFDFRTDERAVEIKDSRLLFEDYNLYSTGKEPLVMNGVFDMSDFERIFMDFNMRAQNFELINTRKKAKSMVFGKVYTNFLGTLKGTPDNLTVRGKLEILDRTDMTYVLKDSPLSVDDRLNDLVQFTSFTDTTATEAIKPAAEGGFDLTLGMSISDAARFHCNLSDDGQSYVDLEGGGDMTLRMTQQGEMRMTGRFTVNSGEMKYSLPVIPLKTFQLVQGSYVEFTGDVMNPTLNIAAKERTKAVVSDNGKQRSVAFDVGVAITKPLNDMGLEFTIEAPEDLTVQNELATMSAEQRGKAAVTLMATGMYMTDETMMSGSGFKANNALNAFLQSEIQNIAGSALKTIDINLGVESGTTETGTSTTDYSFQFAKRFWGNRISVIIGGKVSTGADAKNSAESFINNVSLEYRLDESATRYVKVFYDRDNQDPLEGQLTKTGAGLVLRRKTDRLGELFIFKKKKKKEGDDNYPSVPHRNNTENTAVKPESETTVASE